MDLIEVNISCPNVKAGGLALRHPAGNGSGGHPDRQAPRLGACDGQAFPQRDRRHGDRPGGRGGGGRRGQPHQHAAGMRIDVNTHRPILKMNTGGPVRPCRAAVAVRMVWEVANAVKIPILGMGGVAKAEDAGPADAGPAPLPWRWGLPALPTPSHPSRCGTAWRALAETQGLERSPT